MTTLKDLQEWIAKMETEHGIESDDEVEATLTSEGVKLTFRGAEDYSLQLYAETL